MRLALYQPDIPQNTGAILRLAACLALPVEVIEPAGFDLSDRALRRAGLDYLAHAMLRRHASWEDFRAWHAGEAGPPRLVLATAHGAVAYTDFAFAADDVLLFGRESAGAPAAVHETASARIRIPLRPGLRSLNIALAAAMIAGEALRQTGSFPAPGRR